MNALPDRVVVVGAGVFGASAALELQNRGHRVTLLDPGPLPHQAASSTDISKMVRMDYGSDLFYHELAEASLEGWDRWNHDWPRRLYHETGFLVLAAGPMVAGGFEFESWQALERRGYAPVRTGGDDLERRFPAWNGKGYPDGYINTRGGWAESGAVVRRLLDLCNEAGVTVELDGVAALEDRDARVTGVRTASGRSLGAETVVVSAGTWTPKLLPWLGDRLWTTAQSVVHFGVESPDDFRGDRFIPFSADIAGTGWYGFPALEDGRLKVAHHGGGQRVDPDQPGRVDADHVTRVRAFLAEALPALKDAPLVGDRICMYCDSFDGDLWIDHDPHREGLVVAAGGSGHAFKFAPLLGEIIADVVERRKNRWAPRFRWRARGAIRTEEARFDGV